MSKIEKQLDICPPAYMGKGMNRENFVSTGHCVTSSQEACLSA